MNNHIEPSDQLIPLNWLRAIAALMVVAFHCHVVMKLPKYFGVNVFHFFLAGDSGVQLFFVLSGFVIFLAHRSDAEGDRYALTMFGFKRFRRVYLPLWAVLILITPIVFLGFFGPPPSVGSVVLAYLVLPAPTESLLAVEWTLRHEILFYVLFSLFLWRRWLGLSVLLTWGIAGSALEILNSNNWFVAFLFNSNHMLFLFGMGVAWLYCHGERRGGLTVFMGGIAMFAAAYVLRLEQFLRYDVNVILLGIGGSGIIYGVTTMTSWNRSVPWLDRFGSSSYALYLIHFPMISLLVKIALIVHHHIHLPLQLYFISIVTLCQLAAFCFHQWIESPLIALAGRFKPRIGNGRTTRLRDPSARFERTSSHRGNLS